MDESVFLAAADATLDRIGLALDAALETSDADLDWELKDGVLTIECDDASRIIVNRHVPNRELWIAAKSGGFHFRAVEGRWRDARGGDDLAVALVRLLKTQGRVNVRMPELTAPLEA
ncbi:MAG TPA: iron donor protein CyaY [Casimicrobiaceae bacterium]|nr:iron donor protein CyaY [Casimicrobiaceae bacterium]